MPHRAPHPCAKAGCNVLLHGAKRYCHQHERAVDQRRGTAHERGYDSRWRKASKAFLSQHPLCECEECQGGALRTVAATVVDHKTPHRGNEQLFWDESNWQAMSKQCHDRKTMRELNEDRTIERF